MYHCECDWCRERIDTDKQQYVRASIKMVTGKSDSLGRPDDETEPTRFFHVTPLRSRDEWDRLGIEVRSNEIGDCCYTRALRAIEGGDFEAPDAGLEWRLMPVDGGGERGTTRQPRVAADADLEAFFATLAPSPRHRLWGRFDRQGISTLEQLDAMTDDELLALEGVAWVTRCKIRAFIAARNEARKSTPKEA